MSLRNRNFHYTCDFAFAWQLAKEFRTFREKHSIKLGAQAPTLMKYKEELKKSPAIMALLDEIAGDLLFQSLLFSYLTTTEKKDIIYAEVFRILPHDNQPKKKEDFKKFLAFLNFYFLFVVLRNLEMWLLSPKRAWSGFRQDTSLQEFAPTDKLIKSQSCLNKLFAKWQILGKGGDFGKPPTVNFDHCVVYIAVVKGRIKQFVEPENKNKVNKTDPYKVKTSKIRPYLKFIDGDLSFQPPSPSRQDEGFSFFMLEIPARNFQSVDGKLFRDQEPDEEDSNERYWCRLYQRRESRKDHDNRKNDICRAAALFDGIDDKKRKSSDKERAIHRKKIRDELGIDIMDKEGCRIKTARDISQTDALDYYQHLQGETTADEIDEDQDRRDIEWLGQFWKEVRAEYKFTFQITVGGCDYCINEQKLFDEYFNTSPIPCWEELVEKEVESRDLGTGLKAEFMEKLKIEFEGKMRQLIARYYKRGTE